VHYMPYIGEALTNDPVFVTITFGIHLQGEGACQVLAESKYWITNKE